MTTILVSPTQSGKTRYIQELADEFISQNFSVFIVLRNITADMMQFSSRWNDKYLHDLNKFDILTTDPSIYLCLSNLHQLSKMYCTISRINHRFIIILDEADLIYLDKIESKQSTMLYDEMYESKFLHHKYYITATPFALFKYVPDLRKCNVISLPKNPNYIGFEKISNWHLLGSSVKRLTKTDHYEEYVEIYKNLLKIITKRKSNQVVLFNCTSLIIMQELIGKLFYKDFQITTIIDHGMSTIVYSSTPIEAFSKHQEDFKDGYKYLFKKIQIKSILLELKKLETKKIIIVSGIKAGRGQSYKTEDKNEYHLTDLVYLPPNHQSCETLIQACGRITGIYETTDKKLHIWTNEKSKTSIMSYIDYKNDLMKNTDEKDKRDKIITDLISNLRI